MSAIRWCGLLCFVSLVFAATGNAFQEKKGDEKKQEKKKPAGSFITPEEAGSDFRIQGEYVGEGDKGKLAAQVVALGDGKFDVYLLTGGLPGAGWDTKGRVKVPAKTDESKTTFMSKDVSGSIADGKLSVKGAQGDFTLSRVDRKSPTTGAKAPAGALILFDGTSAAEWGGGKIVEDNLLFCGVNSKKKFGAGKLHIEFRTPFEPKKGGQGRGNSGVYVQGKEVQVLDSFGLKGDSGECGGYYGEAKPAVNMCLPPLSWQTYDIEISTDDKGQTLSTVIHNGVKIHDNFVVRKSPPTPTIIHLQNHGNHVVYRNIWWVEGSK